MTAEKAYLPAALGGRDLTPYGQARNPDGIATDPALLEQCADPPEDAVAQQIAAWLADHHATTDLDSRTSMPGLTGLRSHNFTMLDTIAQQAEPRLRAWARKHGSAVPAAWNAPVTWAATDATQVPRKASGVDGTGNNTGWRTRYLAGTGSFARSLLP